MQQVPIESHVRLWLDEWSERWHALPLGILPQSPFNAVSGHFLISRAPSHQHSLGELMIQGLLGDAQAIILAHERGSTELLTVSQKLEGYTANRAVINVLVTETLKSRVPAGQASPFAEKIFSLGMERVYARVAIGDPAADPWITQIYGNQPAWRRAEYLYLCSLPESLSRAPYVGTEKSAPTWKEVADSLHPDLIKTSDPDFEGFARQFLEARRIANARKPKPPTPRAKRSKEDRFRDVVLDHWLPLGLWLMEYDDALGVLRRLGLLPNLDATGRKRAVSKLASMVLEKGLHHHPSSPLTSVAVRDGKVSDCKWKDGIIPPSVHA